MSAKVQKTFRGFWFVALVLGWTVPAQGVLNLTGTATYLVSTTPVTNNCVSAQSAYWSAAIWYMPRSGSPGVSRYVWSESQPSNDMATAVQHRDGHVFFVMRGASSLWEYDLGPAASDTWHLVIVERDGANLRGYVDNGSAVSFVHDSATVFPVTATSIGALHINNVVVSGLDADIACVATWMNRAIDAGERSALWNGGIPSVAAAHTLANPYYFFELVDGTASAGPMSFLSQVGSPQWVSNHAIEGISLLKNAALVTAIPDCVAFWPFQDAANSDPVDIVHGYALSRTGTQLPAVVPGGVFGTKARAFSTGRGLRAAKAAVPLLDIRGPSAQVSVVGWVRVYAFNQQKFIAGIWDEQSKRQYGMFIGLGLNTNARVMGHFSPEMLHGGPTPGKLYSYDYSASGGPQMANDSRLHCVAFTYDGETARSYVDGIFFPYVYEGPYPPGPGSQNPYTPDISYRGGLSGAGLLGEFSIGTNRVGGNWASQFTGQIAGVAVYSRALATEELTNLSFSLNACTPNVCEDNDPCTLDSCALGLNSNGVAVEICQHESVSCPNGVCNPADGFCVDCLADADCDDDVFCNGPEACVDHVCTAGAPPCAAGEYCDEANGDCDPCGPAACDDHNSCTSDTCSNGLGSNGMPVAVCSHDETICSNGVCNPADGTCVECLSNPDCSDDVFCNGAEICTNHVCQPGPSPCAATENCIEVTAECEPCGPLACDDGNACTVDSCSNGVGTDGFGLAVCAHEPLACSSGLCNPANGECVACVANADCSDGLFCNGAEVCSNGVCGQGPPACAQDQACYEDLNQCEPCGAPGACDDNSACTTDTCSNGVATNGTLTAICSHDALICTSGLCNPADGECVECLAHADCSDGVFCNGPEQCVDHVCQSGTPPCAFDECDEVTDQCVAPPPPDDIDGLDIPVDAGSDALLATQNTATAMGDNVNELNQIYVRSGAGRLRLGVTGNIANASAAVVFFDTFAGGQNPLQVDDFTAAPILMSGTILDSGFSPDYLLYVRAAGQYIDAYVCNLPGNAPIACRYAGRSIIDSHDAHLRYGDNPNAMRVALDNGNLVGVTDVDSNGAATAVSGLEVSMDLADIGITGPAGMLRIMAVLVKPNGHPGNQFLPGVGRGFQVVETGPIDLELVAGWQFAPMALVPMDGNGDGAVDLQDFALFANCTEVDEGLVTMPECQVFDRTRDHRVNLADFASLQRRIRAPAP